MAGRIGHISNGQTLCAAAALAKPPAQAWLVLPVPVEVVRNGVNTVGFTLEAGIKAPLTVEDALVWIRAGKKS